MQREPGRDSLADLLEALRRGDPDALSALVDRQGPRLYNFAARM
jgi:hypothetical protein